MSWVISVSGRTYGPYSEERMRAFAAEGRLAPSSLVSKSVGGPFAPASEDHDLAPIFASEPAPSTAGNQPIVAENAKQARFSRAHENQVSISHFVIIAEMKSGSIVALENELSRLGHAQAIAPQAWILAADQSIGGVRNRLMPKLGKLDQVFIADATHDNVTWINYGPEAEARIRRAWTKRDK